MLRVQLLYSPIFYIDLHNVVIPLKLHSSRRKIMRIMRIRKGLLKNGRLDARAYLQYSREKLEELSKPIYRFIVHDTPTSTYQINIDHER